MYKIVIPHLEGQVQGLPSKSYLHRYLIAAFLSQEVVHIHNYVLSNDIIATIEALKMCGVKINIKKDVLIIDSTNINPPINPIDCNESGSTLRFLIPIMIHLFEDVNFEAQNNLRNRPLKPYFDLFEGCDISYTKTYPLHFLGEFKANNYEIDASVSSQFITGLLFTLPLLNHDTTLILKNKVESRSYIDITLDILKQFNIEIKEVNNIFQIKGNQKFHLNKVIAENDWSNAAFFEVANFLGHQINITNLNLQSKQGDRIITEIIKNKPNMIKMEDCPDLLPILSIACCFFNQPTILYNAKRTRIKESDRLGVMAQNLRLMGVRVVETEDSLTIFPVKRFKVATLKCFNDHRIAMSLIIAATKADYLIIDDIKCIDKSYPTFKDIIINLGGKIDEF